MKRMLLRASAVFGCLVLASLLVVWLLISESRIDREHFEAIHVGMSRSDVERLLGGPPRNECRGAVTVWAPRAGKRLSVRITPGETGGPFFPDAAVDEELVWVGDAGLIAARVGDDGRVRDKYFSTVHDPDLGVVEKVRLKFGR